MTAKKTSNRDLIKNAVAKIITKDGYGSVSMSQVAKLTGLSVATHEACEQLN